MFKLVLLIAVYLGLSILCYYSAPKYIKLTPQLLFILSFLPGMVYAVFYVKRWGLDFDNRTLFTLIIGGVNFVLVSMLQQYFLKKTNKLKTRRNNEYKEDKNVIIPVRKMSLEVMIVIQSITVIWILVVLVIRFGTNISASIFYYRYAYNTGSDYAQLGTMLSNLRYICQNAGYVWVYLFVHGIVFKYKDNRKKIILLLLLSFISEALCGARGNIIFILFAGTLDFYLLYEYKHSWKKHLSMKMIRRIVLIAFILLVSFQGFGNVIGRGSTEKNADSIAKYMSAEYKNLDSYIRNGETAKDISDVLTLRKPLVQISKYISTEMVDENYYQYGGGLGFQSVDGFNLGNVYSAYYSYYHDGKFLGVIIFTGIMAMTLQILFWKALGDIQRWSSQKITISIILFSLGCTACVFSFFAERFFDYIYDLALLKRVIIFYIVSSYTVNGFKNKIVIKKKWKLLRKLE